MLLDDIDSFPYSINVLSKIFRKPVNPFIWGFSAFFLILCFAWNSHNSPQIIFLRNHYFISCFQFFSYRCGDCNLPFTKDFCYFHTCHLFKMNDRNLYKSESLFMQESLRQLHMEIFCHILGKEQRHPKNGCRRL